MTRRRPAANESSPPTKIYALQVRLLSLLRGGPSSSSLDTVAITLDLLVAATSSDPLDNSSRGGHGSGSSGRGGGASSDGSRGVDHRREGWRRAGAAAAGRCLAGMGVLRIEEGGGGDGWCRGGSARRRGACRITSYCITSQHITSRHISSNHDIISAVARFCFVFVACRTAVCGSYCLSLVGGAGRTTVHDQ